MEVSNLLRNIYTVRYFLYHFTIVKISIMWLKPNWTFIVLFPYNKKNITRWVAEDMNFIFSWWKQYFTHSLCSFIKYCFHHSKIKLISLCRHLISSLLLLWLLKDFFKKQHWYVSSDCCRISLRSKLMMMGQGNKW